MKDEIRPLTFNPAPLQASEQLLPFPPWGVAVCVSLVVAAVLPVPLVFLLRYFNVIDDSMGGVGVVSYKKGRIIKEDDDASLIHGRSPSEAPSPGNSIYRKPAAAAAAAAAGLPDSDTAPNGRYGIGYLMADMPDMPESDL